MTVARRIARLGAQARVWQDPDYAPRAEAVEAMLELTDRFTREGLAFALNYRMHQFGEEHAVADWLGSSDLDTSRSVGITPAPLDPVGGLTEAVAALVLAHAVVLETPTPLVAAFLDELADALDGDVHTASHDALVEASDAWIGTSDEEGADVVQRDLEARGIPEERVRAIPTQPRAVVLDGREDQEALSGIAEDLLIHEGLAPFTPRIVWAPAGMSPDTLLNALAGFRELFPPHPGTDGTLALPAAFLASAGQPHATGPGFLLSLGSPEAQAPAHVRWAEYDALGDVEAWAGAQGGAVLVAHPALEGRSTLTQETLDPGDVHRPGLDPGLAAFLRGL